MNRKTVAAIAATVVASMTLTGCSSRSVDIDVTGATAVPGAKGLYRMCDTSTLIYFTKVQGSSDEYDAYFAFHCSYDKATDKWYMINDPGVPVDFKEQSEMNQQQERESK